jgi:hypothetical protein
VGTPPAPRNPNAADHGPSGKKDQQADPPELLWQRQTTCARATGRPTWGNPRADPQPKLLPKIEYRSIIGLFFDSVHSSL